MDKLQLSVWIEDAAAGSGSFGSYCLKLQADDMEVPEAVLLLQMQKSLTVMKQAVDYGLTGVRSTGGLSGGDGSPSETLA